MPVLVLCNLTREMCGLRVVQGIDGVEGIMNSLRCSAVATYFRFEVGEVNPPLFDYPA
jgi:hypothetical protein